MVILNDERMMISYDDQDRDRDMGRDRDVGPGRDWDMGQDRDMDDVFYFLVLSFIFENIDPFMFCIFIIASDINFIFLFYTSPLNYNYIYS